VLDDQDESQVNTGELLQGLFAVKGRLEKLSSSRDPRTRLVQGILKDEDKDAQPIDAESKDKKDVSTTEPRAEIKGSAKDIAEVDRRLGELERVVGSASASLDEVSTLE
jgi:nuclear migration protein JNM1